VRDYAVTVLEKPTKR